jgi:hypothetical protein
MRRIHFRQPEYSSRPLQLIELPIKLFHLTDLLALITETDRRAASAAQLLQGMLCYQD